MCKYEDFFLPGRSQFDGVGGWRICSIHGMMVDRLDFQPNIVAFSYNWIKLRNAAFTCMSILNAYIHCSQMHTYYLGRNQVDLIFPLGGASLGILNWIGLRCKAAYLKEVIRLWINIWKHIHIYIKGSLPRVNISQRQIPKLHTSDCVEKLISVIASIESQRQVWMWIWS